MQYSHHTTADAEIATNLASLVVIRPSVKSLFHRVKYAAASLAINFGYIWLNGLFSRSDLYSSSEICLNPSDEANKKSKKIFS